MDDAFFVRDGSARFRSTDLTRGPWAHDAQHAGPPCALIGWLLEDAHPRDSAMIARFTAEILRPVPIAVLEVETQVLRSGSRVELLAATLRAGGSEIMRASAWRIRLGDIGLEVEPPVAAPGAVEDATEGPFFDGAAPVGYHTAMEVRFVSGGFTEPGPGAAWFRPRVGLVAGEAFSPLARVLVAADSGNGISATADPREVLFVNTDLTVHLRRPLAGEWVCLDAVTRIAPTGIGLASTVLHDEQGPLGTGAQTLYIERR